MRYVTDQSLIDVYIRSCEETTAAFPVSLNKSSNEAGMSPSKRSTI